MTTPGFTVYSSVEDVFYRPDICSLHVKSNIKYRYAHTTVCSKVCNNATSAREVTFSMVLPETAFISSFAIEIDGKVYNAYVKEKEEAKRVYTQAIQLGRTAAHVAVSARDSNQFTVSVNVEPKKIITFHMTYEELLARKLGLYKHIINLDPGQIVQELNVIVNIEESTDITTINVPALKASNDQHSTSTESSNSLVTIECPNPHSAVVKFSPSPEQQKTRSLSGIKEQLIVEYDVDRTTLPSQILVNDGYFAHYFAPEELKSLPKHVTFVLDISGSMQGRKISQLKEAMEKILGDLNSEDCFSLVAFYTRVQVWRTIGDGHWDNASIQETDHKNLVVPATKENILRGKLAIHKLTANGSTNIHEAMMIATHITQLGKKVQLPQTEEQSTPTRLEPIIIFLTDGQPTCGICNKDEIISEITRLNQMSKSNIFALGLGNDVDFNFLKKLALRNSGFSRKIYEASDTALQLTDFYKEVACPLLSDIVFIYQPEQVLPTSVTRKHFFNFFRGSELIVSGRVDPSIPEQEFHFVVTGTSSEGTREFQPKETKVIFFNNTQNKTGFMERLWAYLTIQQLLEEESKFDNQMSLDKKRQAIQLALKYSFVTPVTSLVVVRPDEVHHRAHLETSDGFHNHLGPPSIFGSMNSQAPPTGCFGFGQGVTLSASPAPFKFQQAVSNQISHQRPSFSFGGSQSGGFGSSPAPPGQFSSPGFQQSSIQSTGFTFGVPQTSSPPTGTGALFGSSSTQQCQSRQVAFQRFQQSLSRHSNSETSGFSFGIPQTSPSIKDPGEADRENFVIDKTLNTATCKICQGVITDGDPKHLEQHMEKAHPNFKKLNDSSPFKKRKLSTDNSGGNESITVAINEISLIDACVDMIIVDGRPSSIFNDSGLKKILDPITAGLNNPGYSITADLIHQKISNQSSEVDKVLHEEMSSALVTLKLETITKYKRIFLAIHAQYVQNQKRNIRTLAVKELQLHYNKDDIANIITSTLHKFGMKPEAVLYITVNSVTNIPKFSQPTSADENTSLEDSTFAAEHERKFLNIMLQASSVVGIPGFIYPIYTLELAIYDALQTEEITIGKAREVAKKFIDTSLASSNLKTMTYIPTRLDTIGTYFETLLWEMAIKNAFTQPDLLLSDDEWETIRSIVNVLNILKSTLQNLHENNCYFDSMYRIWMNSQETMSKCGTKFSEKLSTNMKNRIGEVLQNAALLSTIFVAPGQSSILSDSERSSAIEELKKLWLRLSASKEGREGEVMEKFKQLQSHSNVERINQWELVPELTPELNMLAVVLSSLPVLHKTEHRLFSNLSFLLTSDTADIKESIVKLRCFKVFNNA